MWQPIETAPKDGTTILVWRWGRVALTKWDPDGYVKNKRPYWADFVMGKTRAQNTPPTHWMPLPDPPE
jgi:hypothetical protein